MRVFRMLAALVTVAGLALVNGCGSGAGGAFVGVTTAGSGDELAAGITALNSTTFKVSATTSSRGFSVVMEGAADPALRAVRLTQSAIDIVVLGTDVYVRSRELALPGVNIDKWAHLDKRRANHLASLGISDTDDITGTLVLVESLTSIERGRPHELRGTFDFPTGRSLLPDATPLTGDPVHEGTWLARFDAQGRLIRVSVTVSSFTRETTYSGFGSAVTVERPPAGETVEAPESLYRIYSK